MEKENKKVELNKIIADRKDKKGTIINARPGIETPSIGIIASEDGWMNGPWDKAISPDDFTIHASQITPAQLAALTKLGAKVTDRVSKGVEISVAADNLEQAKEILSKK